MCLKPCLSNPKTFHPKRVFKNAPTWPRAAHLVPALNFAKDRFKGAVMTEYQNEIWELALSQKPGTNKWQLSWEKSTKKFMRDTKGDPWEEKSTDKSPKIKRKKAQEAETAKDDEEETVGAAEAPKIRKKKAQEAETTKDDDEETGSRKQQRTK